MRRQLFSLTGGAAGEKQLHLIHLLATFFKEIQCL
jgi:hypothetical protein